MIEVDDIEVRKYGSTTCCNPSEDFPEAGRAANAAIARRTGAQSVKNVYLEKRTPRTQEFFELKIEAATTPETSRYVVRTGKIGAKGRTEISGWMSAMNAVTIGQKLVFRAKRDGFREPVVAAVPVPSVRARPPAPRKGRPPMRLSLLKGAWVAKERARGEHQAEWGGAHRHFAFLSDGSRVLVGGPTDTMRIVDLAGDRIVGALPSLNGSVPTCLAVSSDGALAASAVDAWEPGPYPLYLWSLAKQKRVKLLKNSAPIRSVAFDCNGQLLWATDGECRVHRWSLPDARPLAAASGRGQGMSVAASPVEPGIAVSTGDDAMFLWNARKAKPIARWNEPSDSARQILAFSDDGKRILSAGRTGEIRVRDRSTGDVVSRFHAGSELIYGVARFASTDRLVTLGDDRIVRLWDDRRGKMLSRFALREKGEFPGMAISPPWIIATGKPFTVLKLE